ncbi:TIGR00282 family metallophosphoesterase [Chloroflexota bacterium]
MQIMMVGDVIGRPGRRAVREVMPGLRQRYLPELVIANAENAAGGLGLSLSTAEELLESGVDILTSGNHIWDQKDIIPHLNGGLPILRPLNYPLGVPGRGFMRKDDVLVINLEGRIFMRQIDCPFRSVDRLLSEMENKPPVIIVDFHAEATSEKVALGRYLDGRVSAVLGTHTHVGTVDACILPKGTAFVSDVGMVGPSDSVIGNDVGAVINRFLTGIHHGLSVGKGKAVLNAVLVEVEEDTGRAVSIKRIDIEDC